MIKSVIWGNSLKPILLLILLAAGFQCLLYPTSNNHWGSNQTTSLNTVSTTSLFSATLSFKLAGYCIEQLGSLETTSPNQYSSTFTKDQREVIPPLSSQEITSYNRLFFAQSEEIIDPDGRLGKGAKDSAVDMVSGGFKLAGNVAGSGMYGVSSGFGYYENSVSNYFSGSWQDLQSTGTGVMSLGSQLYHGNFGEIGTALTGGADKSIGYRIGYAGTGVGSIFAGGGLADIGQLGEAGELVEGLGEAGGEVATVERNVTSEPTTVIGRVKDLQKLEPGEASLLDRLPDLGSPKENWKQNSSVLRQEMNHGLPIRDASVGDTGGQFLNAERNLLQDRGWIFDGSYWTPPTF